MTSYDSVQSSLSWSGLALILVLVVGDLAPEGDAGPCIGGNSPSSSNKKHCFGGVSVATAISWNFSESANKEKGKYKWLLLIMKNNKCNHEYNEGDA